LFNCYRTKWKQANNLKEVEEELLNLEEEYNIKDLLEDMGMRKLLKII